MVGCWPAGGALHSDHLAGRLELIADRIDEVEELRVDVLVFLARVRVRIHHVGVRARADPRGHEVVPVVDVRGHRTTMLAIGEAVVGLIARDGAGV